MTATALLPVTRAADLADVPLARRWLVDQLWSDEAVGIPLCQGSCRIARAA